MSMKTRLGLEKSPLFLMDGSAYIFRSFYANQNMSRADGMQTNVLFMVIRMLLKIMREESPEYFGFILDGKGKNFRHRMYNEYKANRSATPEPLSMQIPPLCEAIKALGIKLVVSEDCEADDCIASITARYQSERPIVIIGADKDLKQCLTPTVTLWDPSGKEERITTLASFMEENGFSPEYWPDYQALVGDSSDNIPGVSGIGHKGATTLMQSFKGVDDIYERLAAVPPNLRKKLEGSEKDAYLSRELARLKKDTCSTISLEDFAPVAPDDKKLMEILQEHELRNLARELSSMLRISRDAVADSPVKSDTAQPIAKAFAPKSKMAQGSANPIEAVKVDKINKAPSVAEQGSLFWNDFSSMDQESLFDTTVSLKSDHLDKTLLFTTALSLDVFSGDTIALVAASEVNGDKKDTRLLIGDGKVEYFLNPLDATNIIHFAKLMAESSKFKLIAPGLKSILENNSELCLIPVDRLFDLSLAGWLLSPEEYDYSLKKLQRLWGSEALALLAETAEAPLPSSMILSLGSVLGEHLKSNQLIELFDKMEMPLMSVLLKMQDAGIGIDVAAFKLFLDETEAELLEISKGIFADAGHDFNIRSAKQLGVILFDELGLQKGRKTTAGQASTSQEALEKLNSEHPIIQKILDFRKLEKLRSTYLDPLPKLADKNNRLHTSFNQSATATGRLSSSNPNLQNIPVRGKHGERMRACFTAAHGNLLVSADYSQIELRVLAHLSEDPTLIEAFKNGEDIHTRTACLLFDVEPKMVTPDQRRNAKTINFGLVYGMGPQKLAQDLGISMKDAKEFIARYFEKLGKLKEYFERVEADAKKFGYVATMTGRRRMCPDILSQNQLLRSRARRQAINTCIQGSAADIIKLAMLAVSEDVALKELGATMILQIHDELLLECPIENAQLAGERLKEIMESVMPGDEKMSIPLLAEAGAGHSWSDAH